MFRPVLSFWDNVTLYKDGTLAVFQARRTFLLKANIRGGTTAADFETATAPGTVIPSQYLNMKFGEFFIIYSQKKRDPKTNILLLSANPDDNQRCIKDYMTPSYKYISSILSFQT